jgi:hypothetical protein
VASLHTTKSSYVTESAGQTERAESGRAIGAAGASGRPDDPAKGASAAGAAIGLVSSTTSHPEGFRSHGEWLLSGNLAYIDPRGQRSSKCRKSILNASRLMTKRLQAQRVRYKCVLVTLTYRKTDEWAPKHISAYIHLVRKYLGKRGHDLMGVWKLEMQKRGAVHYHVLLWLPKGVTLPFADKQGWWKHGASNQVWVKNAYGYCAKYIGKDEHGMIPKGARMFSLLGLEAMEKREVRWWNSPAYVRESWGIEHDARRAPGGGWLSRLTGEVLQSGWQFSGFEYHEGVKHLRFIQAEHRQHARIDYRAAAARQDEINTWENLGRSLLLQSNRIGWILNVERMMNVVT